MQHYLLTYISNVPLAFFFFLLDFFHVRQIIGLIYLVEVFIYLS